MLLTAYAPRCSGSTLGTLERCQRPQSASPSDLLPVLDAPSAGAEGTIVWNVIVTHKMSRNTCNVKAVPTRSTYAWTSPVQHQLSAVGSRFLLADIDAKLVSCAMSAEAIGS